MLERMRDRFRQPLLGGAWSECRDVVGERATFGQRGATGLRELRSGEGRRVGR
jgi:hypothetical protein